MQTDKISANDLIIKLVHAINTDRKDAFYKVASEYCSTLTSGHVKTRLNVAISQKPLQMIQIDSLPNEIKNLLEISRVADENTFVDVEIQAMIDELLKEWNNREVLRKHNIPVRNKILFHGETGSGKTTIARYIAKVANLPFIEVKPELVLDSKLGKTSKSISSILSQIKEPCILFWDEIDTIGKKRADSEGSASYENERMVNTILVQLDKLDNNVIFIGATNRKGVLDIAFLRRFDIETEIPIPTNNFQKYSFAKMLLEYYNLPEEISIIPDDVLTESKNFAELKSRITEIARTHILSKQIRK